MCCCPPACEKCGREIDFKDGEQAEMKQLLWICWACDRANLYRRCDDDATEEEFACDCCWKEQCQMPRGPESAVYFWEDTRKQQKGGWL